MSASVSCVVFAIRRRSFPTRRVSSAKSGISANANSASCQLSTSMPTIVATTVVTFEAIERGRVRDDVLDAADVVRDARLHLARARAREEREREPLQVPEDGRAQVVHDALADLVREQRLDHAEDAGRRSAIAIIPAAFTESARVSFAAIASSTRLSRKAGSTPRAAETTMSTSTAPRAAACTARTGARCGGGSSAAWRGRPDVPGPPRRSGRTCPRRSRVRRRRGVAEVVLAQ